VTGEIDGCRAVVGRGVLEDPLVGAVVCPAGEAVGLGGRVGRGVLALSIVGTTVSLAVDGATVMGVMGRLVGWEVTVIPPGERVGGRLESCAALFNNRATKSLLFASPSRATPFDTRL
jgi:hypothetical protein